jgi:enoyl-CoA hydratase/carnithine racemase
MSEINTAGTVDLAVEQGVATVTFNRPQARNAMTWAMYQQLSEHCRGFKTDQGVRAVVFRGAGGQAFVAGTDIEQFKTFSSGVLRIQTQPTSINSISLRKPLKILDVSSIQLH